MDEAEEEALFARLRQGLDALRRDAALAAGGSPAAVDPGLAAAVARVEASLRTLASGLESLARRADAQDAAVEARIEATVARTTAGLRADIDRLMARTVAPQRPPATPPPRPARRRLAAAVIVLALLAAGMTAVQMQGTPEADWVTHALAARVGEWRAALSGPPPVADPPTTPAPAPATAPVAAPTPADPPPAPPAPPTPPAAASAPPAPAPHVRSLSLRANAAAWVEVRHEHDGHVVLRRTMQPGEVWTVPADPDLVLSTGNAPVLELAVDGNPRKLPQSKGGVLKDVPLDAEAAQE